MLIWEGKELTQRDLNIPTGDNTHPTGAMSFSKGYSGEDQRHYFRNNVFNGLVWQPDPAPEKAHLERAAANFEIVISGKSHGVYLLKLTHNTRTGTETYLQDNTMTQIHWGDAKKIIAKPELLGKRIRLYKLDNSNFRLDIS